MPNDLVVPQLSTHMSKFPKTSAISAAVLSVISAVSLNAHAENEPLQRIEVTGSSIKRIAAEGALPVQVISSEQIRKSGATSVAEVIQKLPAMQGFSVADTAIGSNSGGISTASLHDIGESYTLVLLNGRRIAPTGSGSTINLNSIPMSAIERIEVLTDGASAIYGSDAIAGVVNFVMKRGTKGGEINVESNTPLEGGGKNYNLSATYGFGDLDNDGFSLVVTGRHDGQQQLKSGDRDFSKTAYLPVNYQGKNYVYDKTSAYADPANAVVTFKKLTGETTALPSYSFNPYQKANGGKCAPNNYVSLANAVTSTSISENCAFDFVSTIDIYPESTRDSLFLSGELKVSDTVRLFSDVAYSRLNLLARIAPNPVPVSIPTTSAYFTTYVKPYLSADQLAHLNSVTAYYRASDFGTRDSRTITDAKHLVLGGEADIGNSWNVNGGLSWSQNSIDERYVGGYFKKAEFNSMVSSLAFDPSCPAATRATRPNRPSAIRSSTAASARPTRLWWVSTSMPRVRSTSCRRAL